MACGGVWVCRLEMMSTGKTTVCRVKSSRTLQDTLSVILQKHQLKLQDTLVTMVTVDAARARCDERR